MKNIDKMYKLLILVVLLITSIQNNYAQQLSQNITGTYTGTWQYDSNNERFIVKIWQEGNVFKGHYKKMQLNNGTLGNTIYNSNKVYQNGVKFPFTIYTKNSSQYGLSGFVSDNTIVSGNEDFRDGNLQMKMTTMVLPNGCNGCVVKASWKVTPTGGLIVGTPPPFSIPLDIELTKVSNTITLD